MVTSYIHTYISALLHVELCSDQLGKMRSYIFPANLLFLILTFSETFTRSRFPLHEYGPCTTFTFHSVYVFVYFLITKTYSMYKIRLSYFSFLVQFYNIFLLPFEYFLVFLSSRFAYFTIETTNVRQLISIYNTHPKYFILLFYYHFPI